MELRASREFRFEGGKDVVVDTMVLAHGWAESAFGEVDLGDKRLTERTVQVAAAMADDPGGSIPKQNKVWKATKGAYRLFDHERATFEAMLQPHWRQTRQSAAECDVVLMIQDTTELDYTSHARTAGLGRFGNGPIWESGLGMLLHNVLAVCPPDQDRAQPRVLGLAWSKLWCREPERTREERRQRRNKFKKSWPRESERWAQAVGEIGAAQTPSTLWVHVGDREADIFDLYKRCTESAGLGFIVRVTQPRNASCGHVDDQQPIRSKDRPKQTLTQLARSLPALGETTLQVAGKSNRAARVAKLKISGGPVTVWSPWHDSRTARPLLLWVVRVWESEEPAGVKPIEWILLTSLPVNDADDAQRIASWYALRWTVEEYHKCLKSGCGVQERQLESVDRLSPLIGMLSVVAVRLLQLKHETRATPDRPARQCLPQMQVQTLLAYLKQNGSKRNARSLTLRQFTHEVAKLGGFIGRKSDGEPGWQTLWRGWHELELMTRGFQLASGSMRYG
jgi:hypothetical protein